MYYCCTHPGGHPVLLDDVTPSQIRSARSVHKLLTGDLDSSVGGFPAFPGRERHYLRAQIARIAHATTLCPTGLYTMPEEAEEPEPNEEYAALPVVQMRDSRSWCHWCEHSSRLQLHTSFEWQALSAACLRLAHRHPHGC